MRKRRPNPHGFSRRRIVGEAVLDYLESRLLFATLDVTNYGAHPNDSGDDRSGIVAAINASHDGDTIYFPAGTYNLSNEISTNSGDIHVPLGRGRIYKGETTFTTAPDGTWTMQDRSILVSTGTNGSSKLNSIFNFRETNPNPNTFNVKFSNLTFRGNGLNLATNVGAMVEGVIVDNCHFDVQGGGNNDGIDFTTGLRNSQITNNIFWEGGNNGIYGYSWDHLTIANNWFTNPPSSIGNEGIHLTGFGYCPNLLVEQNYFSGLHRMGIELQGSGVNTIVQDNWYENPVILSDHSQNGATFAYSIVDDQAVNVSTLRNYVKAPMNAQAPDGTGVRIVFELGGQNILSQDNYVDGGNDVVAINGSHSTGLVSHNLFKNFNHFTGNNNGSTATVDKSAGVNGPNVVITSWSLSRGRPGPNRRFGEAPPPPPPPPDLPIAPANLAGMQVGSTEIDLNWADLASNETGYFVQESTDDATWITITDPTLPQDSTGFNVTGLTPGTDYHFRVIAFNDNGNSDPSNDLLITSGAPGKPLTPTNLSATSIGTNRIDLTWTDNTNPPDNETGYYVQRLSDDGVTWILMATLPADSETYSMTSLSSGLTYSFQVIAFSPTAQSDPSNIATAQTPIAIAAVSPNATSRRSRAAYTYQSSTDTAVQPPIAATS